MSEENTFTARPASLQVRMLATKALEAAGDDGVAAYGDLLCATLLYASGLGASAEDVKRHIDEAYPLVAEVADEMVDEAARREGEE